MKKVILLVEDDKDIRRNVKQLLELENYLVLEAEHGQAALDQLTNSTSLPNLILLDLMMPVMDGFEFAEKLRAHARFSALPIVIMTADGRVEEKQRRVRALAGLRKPADIEEILSVIAKHVA